MVLSTTIGETLASHAAQVPGASAILYDGLPLLSYGELDQLIGRIGAQLRRAGLGPASRVAVALPRGPEAAVVSLAVCSSAILLPINLTLSAGDIRAELAKMRPDALIVAAGGELPEWAEGAAGVFRARSVVASLNEIALRQETPVTRATAGEAREIGPRSVAVVFRTSGTTGEAKRVPVTHENLIEMTRRMQGGLGLTSADRSACIMPLHYTAGFKATLLVPLLIGCSVALPATSELPEVDRWLATMAPTWLTAAPASLQAMAERLLARREAGRPASKLRFVLSTSSYLADPVRRDLEAALGVPVLEFYGLCEAGMVTVPPIPPAASKPGTVGLIPAGELEVRDDGGKVLTTGQVGNIMLRGPGLAPGYIDDVDDPPAGLVDGWLSTGDLGTVDGDGFLTVVGRTKEIINRGGEKVSPYDVEKALLGHPAVREAAAFAVPHPRLGENVAAAVVLKPGQTTTSSALIDFLYDRLAPFQLPRQVHVLARLPTGATGKISRPQLSAEFANHVRVVAPPEQPLQIQIAEVWRRYLKRDDIGLDDDFFEIGGDSLQATDMMLELEEMTRHAIAPSDIRAELTIRNLALALAHVAASDEIVTKVKGGSGTPLFLCHGDYDGWGIYALRLAELLKHEGPIFLLHSNLDEKSGVDTIDNMAARYLPYLLAAWPEGPLRFAGYCHGGLAAWQLAHRLQALGRKVEHVVLIDTYSINARPLARAIVRTAQTVARLMPRWSVRIRRRIVPDVWAVGRRILQRDRSILLRVARRLLGRSRVGSGAEMGLMSGISLRWAYFAAMANYLPPAIDTDVTCLLSEEYSSRREFAPQVWQRWARNVDCEQVPGKHNTCITSHVAELAVALSRHLAPV